MAIFQTDMAKGIIQPARVITAGSVICASARFVFSSAFTAATDKLELLILPAFCRIVDMTLLGETATATNATIGFMSGTPGDPDNARTVGSEFYSATAVNNTATRMSAVAGFRQPAVGYDRSIGLTLSADVSAGASKVVELLAFYTQI
jgi:hypothetical protein